MCKKYLLVNPSDFLNKIVNFNHNKVSDKTLKKLNDKLISKPEYSFESIRKVSNAAAFLY